MRKQVVQGSRNAQEPIDDQADNDAQHECDQPGRMDRWPLITPTAHVADPARVPVGQWAANSEGPQPDLWCPAS
jgi:hypothetical protein